MQHLHRAVVYSALGEMDRAFELLELGVRDHNGWIGCPRMPMFENFRKDPRYAEHLRRIGPSRRGLGVGNCLTTQVLGPWRYFFRSVGQF